MAPHRPPDVGHVLGRVRELTERFKRGNSDSFESFRELLSLLLHLTIVEGTSFPRIAYQPGRRDRRTISGPTGPNDPLLLTNGRFLRVEINLMIDAGWLKVANASYQYQLDQDGDAWVFRYEYIRTPPHVHPSSHLHVRGTLREAGALAAGTPLERIHFPTGRWSVEGVLRCLIEQFDVEPVNPPEIWRPVLAWTEEQFYDIAHQSLSGPSR